MQSEGLDKDIGFKTKFDRLCNQYHGIFLEGEITKLYCDWALKMAVEDIPSNNPYYTETDTAREGMWE